jgi:hypothetical protein
MWTDENLIPMMLPMFAVSEMFIAVYYRLVVRTLTSGYENVVIANVSRNRGN